MSGSKAAPIILVSKLSWSATHAVRFSESFGIKTKTDPDRPVVEMVSFLSSEEMPAAAF